MNLAPGESPLGDMPAIHHRRRLISHTAREPSRTSTCSLRSRSTMSFRRTPRCISPPSRRPPSRRLDLSPSSTSNFHVADASGLDQRVPVTEGESGLGNKLLHSRARTLWLRVARAYG